MGSGQPVRIPDEGHEVVLERVCAIDVGKQVGTVCVRTPDETRPGRRTSVVWDVPATARAVIGLADRLVAQRVAKVTVESTSDYWRIWFYLLQARGLDVQLVNARDVRNVPGRPKTDRLDAVWLAKLTEKGMLRASFVPPAQIRVLRDYTRMRADLVHEQTRHWQRLEKLLEDALVKVTSVSSKTRTLSVRDMVEALIAGERDPQALARLARGKMKIKYGLLVDAFAGSQFDDHHAELARMLLDQIDALQVQIDKLTGRVGQLVAQLPAAAAPVVSTGGDPVGGAGGGQPEQPPPVLGAVPRLVEVPGISPEGAQSVLAEIGLDMSVFPTAGHLVSWARRCPRTIQSGKKTTSGKTGKGNPYLGAVLGQASSAAARTDTFLGARYRRLVKRRGKAKAQAAVGRSILVIIWHLLADPTARYHDLGPDHYTTHINTQRKVRNLIHQLEALGHQVTLQPAA